MGRRGWWKAVAVGMGCVLAVVGLTGATASDAVQQRAFDAARGGDYVAALPLFVRVLRAAPTAANWNNVGVTLMRMGRYVDAFDCFRQCLAMAPGNPDCTSNVKELRGFADQRGMDLNAAAGTTPYGKPGFLTGREDATRDAAVAVGVDGDAVSYIDPVAREAYLPLPRSQLLHTVRPLPRVPHDQLYTNPAYAAYARGLAPFILTGLMNTTGWQQVVERTGVSLADLPALVSRFGDVQVDYYPANMEREKVRPVFQTFANAMADLQGQPIPDSTAATTFPRSLSSPARYLQWNINAPDWRRLARLMGPLPPLFTSDEAWLDACLPDDDLRTEFFIMSHWRMLIIGTREAGMFNHKDTLRTSSWQVQLVGAKTWHLCAPDQDAFMYGAGQVNTLHPDYDAFPRFMQATCYLDTVSAGEAVYYPMDYWHQTFNEATPSASITGTLTDSGNVRYMEREFRREMGLVGDGARLDGSPPASTRFRSPSSALRRALLERCFPAWRAQWGNPLDDGPLAP